MIDYLPDSTLRIEIRITSETEREFHFEAQTPETCAIIASLKESQGE